MRDVTCQHGLKSQCSESDFQPPNATGIVKLFLKNASGASPCPLLTLLEDFPVRPRLLPTAKVAGATQLASADIRKTAHFVDPWALQKAAWQKLVADTCQSILNAQIVGICHVAQAGPPSSAVETTSQRFFSTLSLFESRSS